MKTITTVEELMTELENTKYGYYGLRGVHQNDVEAVERGATYLDCSFNWVDGEQTEEKLNGTCALGVTEDNTANEIIERYKKARNMYSIDCETVYLIADKNCEYGEDEDEVILGGNGYGADVIAEVIL